ncbi:MAG: DUF5522 domain-containing protein [Myxococcota bacterium]
MRSAAQLAHDLAMERGEPHYRDPDTGYRVFTAATLLGRGKCCGCGCRHCPWAHEAIPLDVRAQRIVVPSFLHGRSPAEPARVLFWSGGKDSYLALRAMAKKGTAGIVLLTTFSLPTRIVAHQEIAIGAVVDQAEALRLPLIGVPLPPESPYVERLTQGLDLLPNIASLAFGDLHLESIRGWRESAMADVVKARGAELAFPLWRVGYDQLLDDWEASGAVAEVCAVPEPERIAPCGLGARFDRAFVERLPDSVDAFGENGEFHSYVRPETLGPF